MADTDNLNQSNQTMQELMASLAEGQILLTDTLKNIAPIIEEANRLLKNQTEATKENTQQQQQAQNRQTQHTSTNAAAGGADPEVMQSLLSTTNAILQATLRSEAQKVKQEQQVDINKATQEQVKDLRGQAAAVEGRAFGGGGGVTPESDYAQQRAAYVKRMREYMYHMTSDDPNGYYKYVYENPAAYPYQAKTMGRILGGYAEQKDYAFLKDYFYREARENGQSWLTSHISASWKARKVIGSQQLHRMGIDVGPGAEKGSFASGILGDALAVFGGTIGKIGQFLLNQFIKLGEFLVQGFKEYWGVTAMKERLAVRDQVRLSTHVLGSNLSIGDISTQQLNTSWGLARRMGFSGSATEWGKELTRAANAGLSSDLSDRMIERSAMDMFMARQGFGVNINETQYANMFRANRGQLDMVHILNAIRAVSFANAGGRGTTAGFDNMEKLFESLASHVLHTNDGFRSMINNMGTFAKLLANSSISMNELQNLIGATQSSTLQQRMMVAYYSGEANLLEGSERQIGMSRRDPAALIRLQARALLNMAAQQGFSAGDLSSNALVRETMLERFNMSALGRLPNVIQTLQELASGKTTHNTNEATRLLQDEKQILNKQLEGIEALNNTAKYIQAWLFTDGGTDGFMDSMKKMFTKAGDELDEFLGISDPTMQLKMDDANEGTKRELLGQIADSTRQGATYMQSMVEDKTRTESFYDNGGY